MGFFALLMGIDAAEHSVRDPQGRAQLFFKALKAPVRPSLYALCLLRKSEGGHRSAGRIGKRGGLKAGAPGACSTH